MPEDTTNTIDTTETMETTQRITTISEVQEAVKAALEENVWFGLHGVPLLVENAKDIEYQVKSAMSSVGITATVATPSLTYRGDYVHEPNDRHPYWEISGLNVAVVENPTLNRGRAGYATALDTALQVAETLNGIPTVCNATIQQSVQGGLVVVQVAAVSNIVFALEKSAT